MSALVVAQEIKLSRALAGNDPRKRNRVLKTLRRWLAARSRSSFDFTENDFMRLWKGLFYCVWMSDKPLVQEELCESIAKLFECFTKIETSVLFYKCCLKTLAREWFGIDQHRLDKFLMFVRRITRGVLTSIKTHEWSDEAMNLIEDCLVREDGLFSSPTPNDARMALGLQLHIVDCWMEELAKVSRGDISSEVVTKSVKPFAIYLCYGNEHRLAYTIVNNIFTHLLRQTDAGIEYAEKELAWRNAGFPNGDIDAMEKIEIDDEDNEDDDDEEEANVSDEKPALDPRAGRVDVMLPQLPVDFKGIADMLRNLIPESNINCSNRKRMKEIISSYEKMASGEYPLKMKTIKLPEDPVFKMPNVTRAAQALLEFEKKLEMTEEDEELRGLNKRQKRRLLQKRRKKGIDQPEDDDEDQSSTPPMTKKAKIRNNISSGDWRVEDLKIDSHETENGTLHINGFAIKKNNLVIEKFKSKPDNAMRQRNDLQKSKPDNTTKQQYNLTKSKLEKIKQQNNFTKSKPENTAEQQNFTKSKSDNKMQQRNSLTLGQSQQKKVNIALTKNTSHTTIDYLKSVKQSPEVPFDSGKKPTKTLLKPNTMPSPINPFYKKKLLLNFK